MQMKGSFKLPFFYFINRSYSIERRQNLFDLKNYFFSIFQKKVVAQQDSLEEVINLDPDRANPFLQISYSTQKAILERSIK